MTEKPGQEETPEVPDQTLVERATRKDMSAYNELVQRYHSRIYSLAYNMTANREDAEDLVQEVFVKAYSSLSNFRGQSSFYTWIYRIAVNRAINFIKKRKRRTTQSLDDVDQAIERDSAYVELSSKNTPFRDMAITEIQEKLNKALMKLSEKHRVVVVLHDVQGVPHDEIARTLGLSSGTVRSRLFYARKILQGELAELAP